MNPRSKAMIPSALCLALALACGGAIAQSSGGGGGTSGSSGSAQGQAGQPRDGQGAGTAAGANGMNGARGTTRGCENLATSGPQRMPEAARPVGTPTRGAANKGSWDTQPNCTNGQENYPQNGQGGATRNPPSGGGTD